LHATWHLAVLVCAFDVPPLVLAVDIGTVAELVGVGGVVHDCLPAGLAVLRHGVAESFLFDLGPGTGVGLGTGRLGHLGLALRSLGLGLLRGCRLLLVGLLALLLGLLLGLGGFRRGLLDLGLGLWLDLGLGLRLFRLCLGLGGLGCGLLGLGLGLLVSCL